MVSGKMKVRYLSFSREWTGVLAELFSLSTKWIRGWYRCMEFRTIWQNIFVLVPLSLNSSSVTHVALFVHLIIGQLNLFESDHLLPQLITRIRYVRVSAETVRRRRVGFPSDKPWGSVVCVSIPLVINRDDVHEDPISFVEISVEKWDSNRGEHSPVKFGNSEWEIIEEYWIREEEADQRDQSGDVRWKTG